MTERPRTFQCPPNDFYAINNRAEAGEFDIWMLEVGVMVETGRVNKKGKKERRRDSGWTIYVSWPNDAPAVDEGPEPEVCGPFCILHHQKAIPVEQTEFDLLKGEMPF